MRKLVCLLFILIFNKVCFSQDSLSNFPKKTAKNAVFLELFGRTGLYSFNYERYFKVENEIKKSFKIGVSYFGTQRNDYVSIPYGIYFSLGKRKGHFECGLGQAFNYYTNDYEYYYYNPSYSLNGYDGFYNSIYYKGTTTSIYLSHYLSFGYKYLAVNSGLFFGFNAIVFLPNISLSYNRPSPDYYSNRKYFLSSSSGSSNNIVDLFFYPWFGMNFGYRF